MVALYLPLSSTCNAVARSLFCYVTIISWTWMRLQPSKGPGRGALHGKDLLLQGGLQSAPVMRIKGLIEQGSAGHLYGRAHRNGKAGMLA